MLVLVLDLLIWGLTAYEIVHAFNCGSQTILNSPMLRFTSVPYPILRMKCTKGSLPTVIQSPTCHQTTSTQSTSSSSQLSVLPSPFLFRICFVCEDLITIFSYSSS